MYNVRWLLVPLHITHFQACSRNMIIFNDRNKELSVLFNSVAQSGPTLCHPMNRSMPGLPVHHQLPEFTQTHAHWVSDAIQSSHPLSSPSPPAPNPSQYQGLFQWVNSSHEVAKVLEFQPQCQSLNEHPGLICFRMDWLDLLAVQGTLKSLLQHHSSKASIFRRSAFFTIQLSHPYMTTGKTIDLTRWTFVGKVMSLLFNMLSRLVIAFLPRSKHLLISWLQSPSAVILELQKIKSDTVSTVFPSISHEVMGPDAMILVFWMSHFTLEGLKYSSPETYVNFHWTHWPELMWSQEMSIYHELEIYLANKVNDDHI